MVKAYLATAAALGLLLAIGGPADAGGRGGHATPFTPPGLASPHNNGFATYNDTTNGIILSLPKGWGQGSASWKSNLTSSPPNLGTLGAADWSLFPPPGLR